MFNFYLNIHSYLLYAKTNIILIFGVTLAIIFFTMLIIKLKILPKAPVVNPPLMKKPSSVITSHDIKAITGEDIMGTQLDLARAYIELGKKKLAKQILTHVHQHGDTNQQQAALQLMSNL